jgi:hypothetical protein
MARHPAGQGLEQSGVALLRPALGRAIHSCQWTYTARPSRQLDGSQTEERRWPTTTTCKVLPPRRHCELAALGSARAAQPRFDSERQARREAKALSDTWPSAEDPPTRATG